MEGAAGVMLEAGAGTSSTLGLPTMLAYSSAVMVPNSGFGSCTQAPDRTPRQLHWRSEGRYSCPAGIGSCYNHLQQVQCAEFGTTSPKQGAMSSKAVACCFTWRMHALGAREAMHLRSTDTKLLLKYPATDSNQLGRGVQDQHPSE